MTDIKEYFKNLPQKNHGRAAGLTARYKFIIEDAGTWIVDVADGKVSVSEGDAEVPCTIRVRAEHFAQIIAGTLNSQMAFMSGQLIIDGDMGLAMKLNAVL